MENICQSENNTLICDKGDILLKSYLNLENNKKVYNLTFNIDNINPNKLNFENLLNHNIYTLLEKINPELIDKIQILNVYNDNAADIIIILKNIVKELGIKQKYILFYTKRKIDLENNIIYFNNYDINLMDPDLAYHYTDMLKLYKNYEALIYKIGSIEIKIKNTKISDIYNKTNNNNVNLEFDTKFQLLMDDELPLHMEDIIGLMIKKLFYNLKQFIDKLK
tara:strand:- start:554 stop:1219 length:666 start_codon:yes stop_codon:yes gene_type:complete